MKFHLNRKDQHKKIVPDSLNKRRGELNNEDNNGGHWEFFQDQLGKWKWIQVDFDGIFQKASHKGYNKYGECVEDALKSGYLSADCVIFIPDAIPA